MLQVDGLRYRYPGASRPALDSVSFEVRPGEVVGVLGPSGAGKSTAQKVVVRLLRDYAGSARLFGREARDWGEDLYERVGVSFELPNHYLRLTARENLALFARLYASPTTDPDALLDRVGLAADADTRVSAFSKGMQMRLGVARALVHRPDLLVLDEPTSGLDPVTARLVKDVVRAERDRGAAVFLSTHDMAVADDLCDRVAFLVDGRIAALDTPRALKLRGGRRRVRVEHRTAAGTAVACFDLDGLGQDPGFSALLRSGSVETIHSDEATLEQVFVDVTGRRLS